MPFTIFEKNHIILLRKAITCDKNGEAIQKRHFFSKIYTRGGFAMRVKISIKDMNQVTKINQIVCRYPYDIWIHGKSGMVDAKSILGIFALRIDEDLYLVTEDDIDTRLLYKELENYIDIEQEI